MTVKERVKFYIFCAIGHVSDGDGTQSPSGVSEGESWLTTLNACPIGHVSDGDGTQSPSGVVKDETGATILNSCATGCMTDCEAAP